ncbi:hypothetical protein [uncultured Stenotrophomonas sp.]|uniref:hypothetical protein n=1 Tax=uncultured Stenotrophomonas sp. TaxID=165438 RepID=UPI0028EC5B91|nr:hypothetical protein [uncultured Stenotrophomonas sp.]
MLDFEKLGLSDAEISAIAMVGDELHVTYVDWQERIRRLRFGNVAGYQAFCPERRELSHGTLDLEDPLIGVACKMAGESFTQGFKVYSFVSVWAEGLVLRVIAQEVFLDSTD